MVLEKLVLRRFQKHEKKVIDFDPGVTTIIGASARGKSAVIRALRWVCFNAPRGKSFIHKREGVASVSLHVDGRVIKRTTGKSVNSYHLDRKRYVSFGSGKLPSPIENVLRLCPTNFQRQLDPVFLFSETPGQVSKSLNEVINLQLIDDVLSGITSRVRTADRDLEYSRNQVEECRDLVQSLAFVDDLATDFRAMIAAYELHSSALSQNQLRAGRISRACELSKKLRPLLDAKLDAEKLSDLGARLQSISVSTKRLKRLAVKAKELGTIRELLTDVDKLVTFRAKADKLARDNQESDLLIAEVIEKRTGLCQLRHAIWLREAELQSLCRGRCPLCGKKNKSSS